MIIDCEQSYFFLRSRAQSDGKIMQIKKLNEEGLGRGRKKSRLRRSQQEKKDCSQSIAIKTQISFLLLYSGTAVIVMMKKMPRQPETPKL